MVGKKKTTTKKGKGITLTTPSKQAVRMITDMRMIGLSGSGLAPPGAQTHPELYRRSAGGLSMPGFNRGLGVKRHLKGRGIENPFAKL
jgi:hypothetical protein